MRILHLSADYPDPLAPQKTKAVSNLLALVPEHEHHVYSLNRVDWRLGIEALHFADAAGSGHRAIAYGAPSRGIMLRTFLDRLADWIAADLERRGLVPTLIHAHKLSVEGLLADRLGARFGCPVAVSVQGDSDTRIIGARRDLWPVWRRVWQGAAAAFPFTPWARDWVDARLGPRQRPTDPLPCPTASDAMLTPGPAGPIFRSAFHLGVAGRKNAAGLIAAVGRAATAVPEIQLEILGGGSPEAFARLSRLAARRAHGRVRFLGHVAHDGVQALFNGSCAFALVSHRESFGMVYTEALLAGAPCLVPRNWGIDGYLPDGSAVLAAPASDTSAIAEALVRLAREEAAFKARLRDMQRSGALDFLRREAIRRTYAGALARIAAAAATTPDRATPNRAAPGGAARGGPR